MSDDGLAQTIDDLGRGFAALQAKLDEVEREAKADRRDPVTAEVVEKMSTEVAELQSRLDRAERKASRPGFDARGEAEPDERKASFLKAMRKSHSWASLEAKAVDADFANNSTSGGVAIPETIAQQILAKVKDISPFRGLVRVTSVSNPAYERIVDVKGQASGWAGESTSRDESATPALQRVTFTHGELFSVAKTSNWALNDLMFDVERWLVDSVAEEFAYQEGVAIVSGNGTNKPTGFLNGSPSASGDEDSPARAFGTLQYVPTGAAGAFAPLSTTSPTSYPSDALYNAVYALKARYRGAARWTMAKGTIAEIVKMRDADGLSIWQPSLAAGAPATLLGYPVFEAEAMPAIGANAYAIAFGDFMDGYELIDIVGMTMMRDELTTKGFTKFYVSRRMGGKVVNDDAIKLIKFAAS